MSYTRYFGDVKVAKIDPHPKCPHDPQIQWFFRLIFPMKLAGKLTPQRHQKSALPWEAYRPAFWPLLSPQPLWHVPPGDFWLPTRKKITLQSSSKIETTH